MTVQVLNVGEVAMEDLQLGDKVLTGNEYQEIYAFGHFHPTREAQFVQILFDLDGQLENLEVTGNHLVYVDGRTHPIRADSIKVGDGLLVGADKSHASVKKIRSIEKKGIYAPLTSRGSIVVNNIAASTYISLQDESPEYMQAGFLNISQQQICHLWMAPFRLMCKLGGGVGFCQTYNDDGRPAWVSIGMGLATWLPGQHIVLQMILFSIALFILSCLALVEKTLVLFVPVAAFLLVWINTKKPISKSIAKENKAGGKQKTV